MNSIQKSARIAGGLYLLITILSIFVHFYVPAQLVVPGDAATTADKIMASEGLFRMGIGSELILLLSEIVVSVILYGLLKPVSKTLALVAAVSRLAMTAIHGNQSAQSFYCVTSIKWRCLPDSIRTRSAECSSHAVSECL